MPAAGVFNAAVFSEILFEKMKRINPAIEDLELHEFRYALDNRYPKPDGWASVNLDSIKDIERLIRTREFYTGVQLKPCVNGTVVLDESILRLTNMLFVGLATGVYSEKWTQARFYFDVRGFFFLVRTVYFTDAALAHLGGKPWKSFEPRQERLEHCQDIGYKDFRAANAEVDHAFVECVKKLVSAKGTPLLLTLAGPTAAGKTEIVERLRAAFDGAGRQIATIEMDNFLLDIDYRDEMGIKSLGKEAYHFELFMRSLRAIMHGERVSIPCYDSSVSSHDIHGNLKPGFAPIEVEPADIIFLEGNFPFQSREVNDLIGMKIVYLTDDPIRLRRKWKRDIDYRKKYNPNYFCNRFFRTQFLRAQDCYRSLLEACDMTVDTTAAAIWATPEVARLL